MGFMGDVTGVEYLRALGIVKKYNNQQISKVIQSQKSCKHEDFSRIYKEGALINTCRNCNHRWEDEKEPKMNSQIYALTHGKFEMTSEDVQKLEKFKKDIAKILIC